MIKVLQIFIVYISFKTFLTAQDITAYDLYKSCKNYHEWVINDFKFPVDEKILFNMGKCQGIIETTGKTMLTLCYENKRNLNINKQLTANLKNIKSITIIREFLSYAESDSSLRKYEGHEYLMNFVSSKWPCKKKI